MVLIDIFNFSIEYYGYLEYCFFWGFLKNKKIKNFLVGIIIVLID